jgi:cargo-transport protein YPP1
MGHLSLVEGSPYKARAEFEDALMHYPNHPSAVIGLSNILLDIYSEVLLPTPAIPGITQPGEASSVGSSLLDLKGPLVLSPKPSGNVPVLPLTSLGLGGGNDLASTQSAKSRPTSSKSTRPDMFEELPAPYKAKSLPLGDRLAARDRAYGLLSSLTKLGAGWNNSDAWFALARAHEESGQVSKAKDALWWCVELEEHTGVREWGCVGVGGYVL